MIVKGYLFMGRPRIDLTGQRFGKLLVIGEKGRINEQVAWECQCDCGNTTVVRSSDLRSGDTKSCGCLRKELHTKHGQNTRKRGETLTYQCWKAMIGRCYRPNNTSFPYYGGRGIKVCKSWWKFRNFYRDMGDKPKGLTLERINGDGDYEPSNCKWASYQEQNQNKRNVKGYSWNKENQKWVAHIQINNNQIYLGSFNKENNAKRAYLKAKKKYHNMI